VMGTPTDGVISKPKSTLIAADQRFLNDAMAGPGHVRNITGRTRLVEDGIEGKHTIACRQFLLHNWVGPDHLRNLVGEPRLAWDGILGPKTIRAHQFALNNARAGERRYPH